MPACIAHKLFADEVANRCRAKGISVYDERMLAIGSQGPDIFFFHRAFPWQPGKMGFSIGQAMHNTSPAKLFEALRKNMKQETVAPDLVKGYLQGFLCHYALDRVAHPFVLYWQGELQKEQPGYGCNPSQYHFRIESALDAMALERLTGRLTKRFSLTSLVQTDEERNAAFARLMAPVMEAYATHPVPLEKLSKAPGDMRQALFWLTNKHGVKYGVLRCGEAILRKGHIATSLMRPVRIDSWDYANTAHREWHNPYDSTLTSTASFWELFDHAADQAVELITGFFGGEELMNLTRDRGFSSGLMGEYSQSIGTRTRF